MEPAELINACFRIIPREEFLFQRDGTPEPIGQLVNIEIWHTSGAGNRLRHYWPMLRLMNADADNWIIGNDPRALKSSTIYLTSDNQPMRIEHEKESDYVIVLTATTTEYIIRGPVWDDDRSLYTIKTYRWPCSSSTFLESRK